MRHDQPEYVPLSPYLTDPFLRELIPVRLTPTPDHSNGPTAQYAAYREWLDSRVHTLPTATSAAVEQPRRRRHAS